MGNSGANTAVRDLQTLFGGGVVGGLSDGQLLERFTSQRDTAALEFLVLRYGTLVWGVCRRILHDHHDAEDAFQATFLVLARKANSVRPRENVARWLYGVAFRTALKARATRTKRRAREVHLAELPERGATPSAQDNDLLSQLDRELSHLPEKYRIPIVLCELEGMTHRDAADQLGWRIGTLSGRLSRARVMLARRFSQRGKTISAGSVAHLLARTARSANVPAGLMAQTIEATCLIATGRGPEAGVVSTEVAVLTRKVVNAMMLSKLKVGIAVLLGGFALGASGIILADRPVSGQKTNVAQGATGQIESPATQPTGTHKAPAEVALASDPPIGELPSYPFRIDPDEVYELPELTFTYRDFHLESGPLAAVPISTEKGITGVMLVGNGKFRYTPEQDRAFEGEFRSAMLRFNPEEQAAIVPLDKGKKVSDRGILEMSRHMLQVVIRHCWQGTKDGGRKQEVLIPPKGAFAADLYSREHGDLLISADGHMKIVYNFTDRKSLYEKR